MSATEAVEEDIRNRQHQVYLSNMETFLVYQTAWLEGDSDAEEDTDDTPAYNDFCKPHTLTCASSACSA